MESEILVAGMFLCFAFFLFLGVPVAWVLGGTAVLFAGVGYLSDIYLDTFTGLDFLTLGIAVNRIFKIMDNWILVALPMFIFMGLMLDESGIAKRMMSSMQDLFGKLHGGLAITVTCIGVILAASTGIIGASVVLLGLLSLQPMLKQGYSKYLALGTVASAGTLGVLIPPSIMLVIMADQMVLSVGDLFMAAVFPGLLLGGLYVAYIIGYGLLFPAKVPLSEDRRQLSLRVLWSVAKAVLPALILIFTVLGSIFAGIATPTEASGVGAFGATILAVAYGRFNLKVLHEVLKATFNTSAFIFAIFIGATLFSLVLRELGGDEIIEEMITGLPFGPYGIVAAILFFIFLLGFFLDWVEITLIILPLVGPVVESLGLGIDGMGVLDKPDLIWFIMLVAITLQTSFLTPPVGFALFYMKGICPPEITTRDIYRGIIPFVILQIIGLTIVALFPMIAIWLPALTY